MRVMGLEDMFLVKDVRMANRSGKGSKTGSSSSQLSRSWPNEGRKSKKYHSVPGTRFSILRCVFLCFLQQVVC